MPFFLWGFAPLRHTSLQPHSPNSASLIVAFLHRNSVSPLVRSYHLSSCLKQPFLISTNLNDHFSSFATAVTTQSALHGDSVASSPECVFPLRRFTRRTFFSTRLTFPCPVSYLASLIIVVYSCDGTCILPHNANLRAFSRTLKMWRPMAGQGRVALGSIRGRSGETRSLDDTQSRRLHVNVATTRQLKHPVEWKTRLVPSQI